MCPVCRRRFARRKRWARLWPVVVYCSSARRGRRDNACAAMLKGQILRRLRRRSRGSSICPSEALPEQGKHDPAQLAAMRAAARCLAHRPVVDIVQRSAVVDPELARGPIRLRLRPGAPGRMR